MEEEHVWIASRAGKKLEGLIRRPKKNGRFPAVIFVHGLGMTMHEWNNSFDEIAERLVTEGFATLQIQFDIFKNNEVRELPLKKRAKQLNEVLEWLEHQSFVDNARMGMVAQSYGAATALSTNLQLVRSIILVGGTYDLQKAIEIVYRELGVKIHYDRDTTLPRSSGEHTTVDAQFWRDANEFDAHKLGQKLKTQSVFVIHGDHDTKNSADIAENFYASLRTKQKKLKIFIGGDHGIIDVPRVMRKEFLDDVVEWFGKTI